MKNKKEQETKTKMENPMSLKKALESKPVFFHPSSSRSHKEEKHGKKSVDREALKHELQKSSSKRVEQKEKGELSPGETVYFEQ